MPYLNRQVGNVSQLVNLFLPDATVSTGVGLANVVASTVRLTWWRDNQATVSSWTLTTGTLGTWAASTIVQVGSTSTLGMYQLSLPDGLFASGSNAAAFVMSSTAAFAPVPFIIDLSSQILAVSSISTPVTVSGATIPFGVSSATIPFGVSSLTAGVNVTSIVGSAAVTSAAGVFGPLAVSSISTPVAASSLSVGVNVTSIVGSAAVTSAAGVFGPVAVSSLTTPVTVSAGSIRVTSANIPFGVSSLTATALGNFFDTGALFFSTAVVSSVVYEIATHATVGGNVGVSAITIPVSVSSGSVAVTSASIPFGVSSIATSVEVSSVIASVRSSIADSLLNRNVSGGANTGRLVKEAIYVLRNKVDAGAGIVYQTDDTTSSWAFTVSTVAGNPIQVITPQ